MLMTANSPAQPAAEFNISAIPHGREGIARMILTAFADAGFGGAQQIATLANAIAESALNPNATSAPPDGGVGLFQLNRTGGLGRGHTVAELQDPATNINLILTEAKKFHAFGEAASLQDAVSTFVRMVVRPANPAEEAIRRLKIAEGLVRSS